VKSFDIGPGLPPRSDSDVRPAARRPAEDAPDEFLSFAAIIESSSDAIISKDLNGTILTWNRGATAIYGYAAEEAIGRSISLLLPADRTGEEQDILEHIRKGQEVDHFETVRIHKGGDPIDVSLMISPIFGKNGIVGASHVARDISERKRLDAARAQLAAIVESSEDAIVSKDLNGTISTWNASAERLYGYPAAEAIGRNIAFLQPPGQEMEEAEILRIIGTGGRVDHFETERVRKGGAIVKVSLTISPIRNRMGAVMGASHIARDITRQKEIEEHLRQTQRLESLGVLAGGVAHDFNNLLTGILGNASLAIELLPDNCDSLQPILGDVVAASERASRLTQQLLAYAGKGRFIVEKLDIAGIIRETARLLQSTIPKDVHVRLDLTDRLPYVEGDAAQMQQVVMNLLLNAAEAIPESGAGDVIITARLEEIDENYIQQVLASDEVQPGAYVTLEVRDTGIGMDEATMERIFEPFFSTKFTGRGLGLAAVLGIVRGHKGALKVWSAPGQGSTFKVLFPVAERSGYALSRATTVREALRGCTETVLVIDDENTVRRTAKASLEARGYTVILADNGRDGIEIFRTRESAITAVLVDLTMPGLNGEEVLRRLTAIRSDVKVVLSSGFNEVEVIQRFAGKGLAGFIHKPYTALALANKISEVIRT
jgi:PAS domain S-box-containing protein